MFSPWWSQETQTAWTWYSKPVVLPMSNIPNQVKLTNRCIWEWKLTSFEIKKDILEHKKDLISVPICQEGNKGNVYF